MSSKYLSCFFIIAIIFMVGCSKPSPVVSDIPESAPALGPIEALSAFSNSMNQLWMSGTMYIKPEIGEGEVIINRGADWNYNITSFLAGACPGGCFRFRIVNIVGTVLEIELTLINPTSLQAYDVRLIYENLYGKKLLNPSSYTDIFKILHVRPFTAFAIEYPDRAFPVGPGATDHETIFIDFPPGSQAAVNFIIAASYPLNTGDPFEINEMRQDGILTPSGGSAELSCMVEDHQQDILSVVIDTSLLTGQGELMIPDPTIPGLQTLTITNSEHAPVGTYSCLIRAKSPNQQDVSTYNYLIAEVTQGIQWEPIEVVHLSPDNWYSVYPDIAFDSQGYAHIIWMEVQNTGYMLWNENIWYSNNKSGDWSAPVELSDAFQNDNDYIVSPPAIAINNQDKICAVWPQCLYNGDRSKLWFNYFDGTSWNGQTQMFDLYMVEVQPALCSDDQFFYLAFRHGGRNGHIMFSRMTPPTLSWIEPVIVNDPIDMDLDLQMDGRREIVAACRGGIFITWLMWDINPEGIWRIMRDESWDGGTTWGPDTSDICDENLHVWQPSIAMDEGGRLYEVWQLDEPDMEKGEIRWDKYDAGSWGTDEILYSHRGAYFPSISVMSNGFQNVCFCDLKLFPSPLYYINSADGINWTDPFQVSPDEGECESPSIDTWQLSRVGITWKQHLETYSNDILYREANF